MRFKNRNRKIAKSCYGQYLFLFRRQSAWVKGSDEWKEITSPTSSNKELEILEQLIDQSGVLDSTDGTATEKVEQLIDKAEDENIWYEISGTFTNNFPSFAKLTCETLPRMDLSNVTTLNYKFSEMPNLKRIDNYLNTENCTNFSSAFSNCKILEYIKGINTSKATRFSATFNGCDILKKIEEPFDLLSMTSQIVGFTWLYALEYIRFESESIPCSIVFGQCKNLTAESIQSIIDGLATLAEGAAAQTLTLSKNLPLTAEQKQAITTAVNNKGWTLAFA